MDTSAILGFQQPNTMQNLSGLLGVANSAQTLQQNQQKTQQGGIDLQERQGMQQVLSDPKNYTDEQGAFDPIKAQANIMKVAPTTGAKYWQEIAQAHSMSTAASQALNNLTSDVRKQIGSTLAAVPAGAPRDVVFGTIEALGSQYKGSEPLVQVFKKGYDNALKGGQAAADAFRLQSARGVLPQPEQQTLASGSLAPISTASGTQLVQTQVGANQPQGSTVATLAPPNQVATSPTGRTGVVNPATAKFTESTTANDQPPVNFPPGERQETWTDLQGQRSAAQQTANAAPVMHDINRTIIQEASKGLNTGWLGSATQKLAGVTGFQVDPKAAATDYNILGKMLERSALTAAQSMGPHTNAGLEASVKANGSLDYTPQAIKKIAYLNDALVSGSELYRDGLEKAVKADPNGVFAKREFDSQWSKVATPQVLRLKNAVDTGNQEEVQNVLKEVGGKGSKGATALHQALTKMLKMVGQ